MTRGPHSEDAHKYAQDVVSYKKIACNWVIKACQRHLDDLEKSKLPDFPYYFDTEKADRVCRFIELLPHVAGKWRAQNLKITLEPWQKFIACSLFGWCKKTTKMRRFSLAYVCVPRKNAKALALDTPIPTPDGWTTMGEIKVGEFVLGNDGTVREVVAATDVIYGNDCYEMTFSNGEVIVADAGHLWMTDARSDREAARGSYANRMVPQPSIKTTEEIYNTLLCRDENNHRLFVPAAVELPERDLPIHPYVLGAWLGDGSTDSGNITIGDKDAAQMVAQLGFCGHPVRKMCGQYKYTFSTGDRTQKARNSSFQAVLRDNGLLGEKHIPQEYLRGSYEQRMHLLQGLMDTDGTVSKAGQCTFTTTCDRLRDGIIELVASLGLKPTLQNKRATLYGVDCGPCYNVQFWAFSDTPVFTLARKRNRQKANPGKPTRSTTIQLAFCRKVQSVPVRCIQVDHEDGMYLVGRTFLPTHNSTLAAGICLYGLIMDGEAGAQVFSGATSEKQARMVFDPAKEMVRLTPALQEKFGVEVNAKSIVVPTTNSKFEPLIGLSRDGASSSVFCLDEMHEAQSAALYDSIVSGMGARDQPLALVITTAGFDTNGPCHMMQRDMEKMLEGVTDNPEWFGIIYTIDPLDDWTTEAALIKANPNWGISVNAERIIAEQRVAIQSAEKQNNFKTKYMDVWCNARESFFNSEKWIQLADTTLKEEDFTGQPCVIGFDLASQVDLAASVKVFTKPLADGYDHYYVFPKFYIPEDTVFEPSNQHYQKWTNDGYLIATPESEIDLIRVQKDLLDDIQKFNVREICYDKYQATLFKQQIAKETNIECAEIPQNVSYLSDPMKWLDAMIRSGRIHHDGNPVMTWNISNVVAREDANEGVFPRKEKAEKKIDGVTALLNALNRAKYVLKTEEETFEFTGF